MGSPEGGKLFHKELRAVIFAAGLALSAAAACSAIQEKSDTLESSNQTSRHTASVETTVEHPTFGQATTLETDSSLHETKHNGRLPVAYTLAIIMLLGSFKRKQAREPLYGLDGEHDHEPVMQHLYEDDFDDLRKRLEED